MPVPYALETVIGLLDQHHQRATYGAFAALLEVQPLSVMRGLPKSPRYSWIVNLQTELPTDYEDGQMHTSLLERPQILKTMDELTTWLGTVS